VIVSSAARTRETWRYMAAAFPGVRVDYEGRLYENGPDAILAVIREIGRSASAPLVIGHNPGLHDTARLLIAPGARDARQLDEGLPTSGLVVIDFTHQDWRKLALRSGRLDRLVTPRLLKTANG
jgi:phosphohistidine phosphatase